MAFYGQNRLMQMQEEMDRFEQEISGQLARPPMPRGSGSNMSLRFIPHQLHARPVTYAPPSQPSSFPQGISTAAVAAAAIATAANSGPRFQPIPTAGSGGRTTQSSGAVIEAAPTKYTATVNGKNSNEKAFSNTTVPPVVEQNSAASSSGASNKQPAESSRSKDKSTSGGSSNALAYTVVGGSGTSKPSTSAQGPKQHKRYVRVGGGQVWTDPSLNEWDPNDFRLFCGDLGNEVSDELLAKAFRKYPSFQKAKVVRDKKSNKTKGYGFVSFKDPDDFTRALREMDGKYVGNRPIKLRKSNWKDRNMEIVRKKVKVKQKLGLKL